MADGFRPGTPSLRAEVVGTVGIVFAFVCIALSVAFSDGSIQWFRWFSVAVMAVLAIVQSIRLRRRWLACRR